MVRILDVHSLTPYNKEYELNLRATSRDRGKKKATRWAIRGYRPTLALIYSDGSTQSLFNRRRSRVIARDFQDGGFGRLIRLVGLAFVGASE